MLPTARETELVVLQVAPARWHKQGLFQWTNTPNVKSVPQLRDVGQIVDFDDMSEFAWLASAGMITYDPDSTSNSPTRSPTQIFSKNKGIIRPDAGKKLQMACTLA